MRRRLVCRAGSPPVATGRCVFMIKNMITEVRKLWPDVRKSSGFAENAVLFFL
jgi:hypothetical protein